MRIRLASVFVIGTLVMGTATRANEQVPDFSGTWRLDPARSATTGGPERIDGTGPGGVRTPPVKTVDVRPEYPPDALRRRIGGRILIDATIDRQGRVVDARVLRSVPELDQAALEAVSQWRFTPAARDGVPIPVSMTVTVTFSVGPGSAAMGVPAAGGGGGRGTGGGSGMGAGPKLEVSIKQDQDRIEVTRETTVGREKLTYRFDGRPVKNKQLGRGGGAPGEYLFESRWEGAKLQSTITGPDRSESKRTETRYLDRDTMVVEIVRPAPDGAPDWHIKQTFVRAQ
jgi:TonB family protein